jgi:hypothetical protein
MTFQILEVFDSHSENVLAKALHHDNPIAVTVRGRKASDIRVGEWFQAEISFDEILGWQVRDDFEDAQSGIWQDQDGIHLLGRIHSILDFGDGRIVIDVYIQNGPEYFTVQLNAEEEDAPDANDALEIVVGHLYLHPISYQNSDHER